MSYTMLTMKNPIVADVTIYVTATNGVRSIAARSTDGADMKGRSERMDYQKAIDYLEDEINGLIEQKNGDVGEFAAKVFQEISGDERIEVMNFAVSAIKELQQYKEFMNVTIGELIETCAKVNKLGTPEEVQAAVEKQRPKKPVHSEWNGINSIPYDLCPNCRKNLCIDGLIGRDKKTMKYCENCGQKLDWSGNDDRE